LFNTGLCGGGGSHEFLSLSRLIRWSCLDEENVAVSVSGMYYRAIHFQLWIAIAILHCLGSLAIAKFYADGDESCAINGDCTC
jgi:hypothetical protein